MSNKIKITIAISAVVAIGVSAYFYSPSAKCRRHAKDCNQGEICLLRSDKSFRCTKKEKALSLDLASPFEKTAIKCFAGTGSEKYGHYREDNYYRVVIGHDPESQDSFDEYPILAPVAGVVKVVEKAASKNEMQRRLVKILIEKGQVISLGDFSKLKVSDGDKVNVGDVLGFNAIGVVQLSAHRPKGRMRVIQDPMFMGTSIDFSMKFNGSMIMASALDCGQ